MNAWIRDLKVILTSTKLRRRLEFGTNVGTNMSIDIAGFKYMSALKDAFSIHISNLTYNEIVTMISGEFYDVEIYAGYKSSVSNLIFKGGVLYITTSQDDNMTSTATILCASDIVAKYGQSRMNLSFNSGINLYSAIKFLSLRAGIPEPNVSTQLKKKFLEEIKNVDDTAGSWLDKLTGSNDTLITNSDQVTGATFSIFDASKSNQRVIKLKRDNIKLVGGYPRLTNDGLTFTIMPTFNFMCGDVIEIDNDLIQMPVLNKSEMTKNYGYYLDKDGHYMIYQMAYSLQNRGSSYNLKLTCKSRGLISNLLKI